VQGVWFRASTQREARRLGVKGRAVNLADGSVEVIACGETQAVAALRAWLGRGPELARVTTVTCEPFTGASEAYVDFTVG
jgi:acylphosphatase